MRLHPLCHLGLVAVSIANSMMLVGGTSPCWAQEPLILSATYEATYPEPSGESAEEEDEDVLERQERHVAERLASVCNQHLGPWIQWLTIAAQSMDLPSQEESELDSSIIEITEDTRQAIQDDEAESSIEIGSIEIGNGEPSSSPSATTTDTAEITELPKESPKPAAPSKLTLREPSSRESDAREPSSRNLRVPRPLNDLGESQSESPRTLSESMKIKAVETPATRSLKSSSEDMRDYLAQEEPTANSIRSSSDDRWQGVDADRAAKPETRELSERPVVKAPVVVPEAKEKSKAPIAASMQRRLERVDDCLEYYLKNPETTTARSPWAVMHALLPFGADYELVGPNGRVNAIGWMCHNGLCRTQRIFTPRGNSFVPNVGGGVQGHEGQFLAILAQCQVPLDYPIQIGNRKFKVEDLVRYEMATCKEKSELTFKLIGLSYYVDSNKQWRSNDGKVWSIQKLIQEELAQPIVGSACGGTHRLMGFSFSVRQRELQGQPINGQYARAAKFVNEYIRYTWQLQNPDGSFSTNWYEGRANEPNEERKVQTTGHMLEWLMFTVADDELTSARVEKAVDFLLSKINDRREHKWPIGPRGHATRALALYQVRIQALLEQRTPGSSASDATIAIKRNVGDAPSADSNSVSSSSPAPSGSREASVSTNRNRVSTPAARPGNPPATRSTGRSNRRFRG